MLRIFIGWDSRFPQAADVLRYSLLEHASIPLEIQYLKRNDRARSLDALSLDGTHSTTSAYSRFLVPHLCNYRGKALFLSSEALCLGDISEIDQLDMQPFALRVAAHGYSPTNVVNVHGCRQTSYPRKSWSSMMLMDCAKLKRWTREAVATQEVGHLQGLQGISDGLIGPIPSNWHALDTLEAQARLVHFTKGGPWSGQDCDHPLAHVWRGMRDDMLAVVQSVRASRAVVAPLISPASLSACALSQESPH